MNIKKNNMTTINLLPRLACLRLWLLLCLFCSAMAVQAQTVRNWIGAGTSGATRNMGSAGNWDSTFNTINISINDVLMFGSNTTAGVGINGGRQLKNDVTGQTNFNPYPISIVFTNIDGYRMTPNAATNKITLNAGGIFQDASVIPWVSGSVSTVVGRNDFFMYFELSANSSIVNNSTASYLSFRHDNTHFNAGTNAYIDNMGFDLTLDGPGAIEFQDPTGTVAGGAIKGDGGFIREVPASSYED